MLISLNARIPFPRPLVYATYRDKLTGFVAYMPKIRQINFKSRQEQDGLIFLEHEWYGGADIPSLARAFINENLLNWTEYSTWDDSEYTATWQIKTHVFTEAVYCTGKNHFLEDGSGTLIESRGEIIIDPKQIKNTPQALTVKIASIVENSLGKQITPNFQQMSEGVCQYLQKAQESTS
ncbi:MULTISPECIES: hypothetical protein [Calothrix]|uniref:Uncharacterized protein n=2 Tax=Calothrix TaxID=1186 RepID=A0ABR8AA06_9CYAN|nr:MULTISPECIES: hypothetical protein [Calothrix]MBD2196835.1 hypothetical protein [Calothrix parietina FACHB-288]MBD2225387.1 hypothetical protein [Calothrix anomala FACHB-343]